MKYTYSVDTLIIIAAAAATVDMMVTFDSYGCDNVFKFNKKTTADKRENAWKKGAINNIQQNEKKQNMT